MKNYQKRHYEEFYLMLSDGSSIKTTRRECFAPAESVTPDNLFRQRWLYSPDGQIAIRLPRNELGETLGKDNANELKTEERITERKTLCVGQTSHASCSKTCEDCPFGEYCDSGYRSNNGIDCKRKCDCCSSYVRRTLSYKEDIETLQELVRQLRKAGSFATENCGIHIHLDGANHTVRSIRNFINIIASKNDLFYKALQISPQRMGYCKKMDSILVEKINRKKPTTMRELENLWYEGYSESTSRHYHSRKKAWKSRIKNIRTVTHFREKLSAATAAENSSVVSTLPADIKLLGVAQPTYQT